MLITNKLPKHVGFIMDGNGRWAKSRHLPREAGHKAGVKAVTEIVTACRDIGIPYLTFFAFSTENWKRPEEEINALFDVFRSYLSYLGKDYQKENVCVKIIGDLSRFPEDLVNACHEVEQKTLLCTGVQMNIALGYGARDEIVYAVNQLIAKGLPVTEQSISSQLYTANQPDPDLIIRTSGETRLSNFLLYQAAYSELYFTDVFWPDFNSEELKKALNWYSERNRRFGAI